MIRLFPTSPKEGDVGHPDLSMGHLFVRSEFRWQKLLL